MGANEANAADGVFKSFSFFYLCQFYIGTLTTQLPLHMELSHSNSLAYHVFSTLAPIAIYVNDVTASFISWRSSARIQDPQVQQ